MNEKLVQIENDFTRQWQDLISAKESEIFLQPGLWQIKTDQIKPEETTSAIEDSADDLIKSFIQRDDVKVTDFKEKKKVKELQIAEVRESVFDENFWLKL